MENSSNIEHYKILYGLYQKILTYNGKWKNFQPYMAAYFRCVKKLKYEVGLTKIEEDCEIRELKINELLLSSNNIDKKVSSTIELFFKKETIN